MSTRTDPLFPYTTRFRSEVGRGHRGEAEGGLEGGRVAELERRRVVQRGQRLVHRLGDLAAAVAGGDAEQAGRAVDHLVAVIGGEVHAFGAGQDARVRLEVAVRGKRHPMLLKRVRDRRDEVHRPGFPKSSGAVPEWTANLSLQSNAA